MSTKNNDIKAPELWDVKNIEVSLDKNYIYLKCYRDDKWFYDCQGYEYGFFQKIKYKTIDEFAIVCVFKFKLYLESENVLKTKSYLFTKRMSEIVSQL